MCPFRCETDSSRGQVTHRSVVIASSTLHAETLATAPCSRQVPHIGTHMDAPLHFLQRGRSIDTLPLEATVGPACVVSVRNRQVIGLDDVRPYRIRTGERLLFKTRNSERSRARDFFEDYVAVSPEAASYLAARS